MELYLHRVSWVTAGDEGTLKVVDFEAGACDFHGFWGLNLKQPFFTELEDSSTMFY